MGQSKMVNPHSIFNDDASLKPNVNNDAEEIKKRMTKIMKIHVKNFI